MPQSHSKAGLRQLRNNKTVDVYFGGDFVCVCDLPSLCAVETTEPSFQREAQERSIFKARTRRSFKFNISTKIKYIDETRDARADYLYNLYDVFSPCCVICVCRCGGTWRRAARPTCTRDYRREDST